jgi:hypothetical protein
MFLWFFAGNSKTSVMALAHKFKNDLEGMLNEALQRLADAIIDSCYQTITTVHQCWTLMHLNVRRAGQPSIARRRQPGG